MSEIEAQLELEAQPSSSRYERSRSPTRDSVVVPVKGSVATCMSSRAWRQQTSLKARVESVLYQFFNGLSLETILSGWHSY